MTRLKMHSLNKINENVGKIANLFPNCVTEAKDENGETLHKIDFDMLRQELSGTLVEGREERYQFTWPDKRQAILTANAPINKTLRPCREESVNFDSTENLYIEGDNLEVLKLLQETYLGKIKMIYIDPPYNTGNDFVYNDEFSVSASEFSEKSGNYDEEGNQIVDNYTRNTESNGRFHTDWLNMMYPRLKLARDLLTDDGVIFISIDDNEVENLKKICNEVFGESNFVDVLHWKRKKQPSFLAKHTAKVMEYVIVYAKNENELGKLSIETLSDATKKVVNLTNQKSERHFSKGVRVKCGENGVIQKGVYKIKTMEIEYLSDVHYEKGRTTEPVDVRALFSVSQEKIDYFIKNDLLFITVNLGLRRDVSFEEQNNQKSITDLILDWGDNQDSEKELNDIFNKKIFDYSKPSNFIKNIVKSVTRKISTNNYSLSTNDYPLILDFFSGSATTAHAVMQLNAEDGGKRKFIMVQLPELTDEKSEAYKAGYKNICEIGKERIRRAGRKIMEEAGLSGQNLDIGFRVLKCDTSNMEDVYYSPDDFDQKNLFKSNIKTDRSPEDLLFQVMLDLGVMLSSKIETREVDDKNVFFVEGKYLVACFDENVDEATIAKIAKEKPYYFVIRDSSMANDSVATNLEQIFMTYSPDTVRRVL